jgi:hypothetical protein
LVSRLFVVSVAPVTLLVSWTDFTAVIQFFSSVVVIAMSDSIMNNLLLKNLATYAPSVEPYAVLHMGAYGIQNNFDDETLRGVRQAWMVGLRGAWALMIALFGMAFLSSFITKWPGSLILTSAAVETEGHESDESNQTKQDVTYNV